MCMVSFFLIYLLVFKCIIISFCSDSMFYMTEKTDDIGVKIISATSREMYDSFSRVGYSF